MTDPTPLSAIFDAPASSPAAQAEPAQQPEPEKVAAAPQATEQSGENAAPPAAEAKAEQAAGMVPQKALEDERHKRQQLEKQLAELMAANKPQQPAPPPVEEPPSYTMFDHPEGPEGFIRDQISRVEQGRIRDRVEMSEALVRQQNGDYDQVVSAFAQAAQIDPALRNAALNHPNPALFAYETGKRIAAAQQLQADPAEYRAKVEAEIRAQIEAEYKAKAEAEAAKQAEIAKAARPNLNQSRDSGGRFAPGWSGPTPLDQLIGAR